MQQERVIGLRVWNIELLFYVILIILKDMKTKVQKSRLRVALYNERSSAQAHSHSEGQFVYPLKGSLWTQAGSGHWFIHADCGLWIPPHLPHSASFKKQVEVIALYLDQKRCIAPLTEQFSVRVSPLLRELLNHARGMNQEAIYQNREFFKLLVQQIVSCRTRDICLPYASESRLLKSMHFVKTQIDQDPTLVEAAKAGGMSPKTMERLFEKHVGSDFRSWKQTVKMVMAAAYLMNGLPITDVALSVGYDSMSAFIHCFKRYYKTTPSKYLR